MPLYEHVFLARQDVSTQAVDGLIAQYKTIVEGLGGQVTKIENWGLKSLAYRIKKNRKAHYALLNIDAPAAAIAEIERQQRLSEDVLRALTIRVDELEEGPSVMLQKRDRDERRDDRRGERGDRGDRSDRGDRGPRRDRAPRRDEEFGEEENA
ncbi:MAG: 30S ribosomal protein S6 [Hyphomicrobiales bacterium]|nr:30S ribosomal protein S6 [Hyphomicrobiales bacterium]